MYSSVISIVRAQCERNKVKSKDLMQLCSLYEQFLTFVFNNNHHIHEIASYDLSSQIFIIENIISKLLCFPALQKTIKV